MGRSNRVSQKGGGLRGRTRTVFRFIARFTALMSILWEGRRRDRVMNERTSSPTKRVWLWGIEKHGGRRGAHLKSLSTGTRTSLMLKYAA